MVEKQLGTQIQQYQDFESGFGWAQLQVRSWQREMWVLRFWNQFQWSEERLWGLELRKLNDWGNELCCKLKRWSWARRDERNCGNEIEEKNHEIEGDWWKYLFEKVKWMARKPENIWYVYNRLRGGRDFWGRTDIEEGDRQIYLKGSLIFTTCPQDWLWILFRFSGHRRFQRLRMIEEDIEENVYLWSSSLQKSNDQRINKRNNQCGADDAANKEWSRQSRAESEIANVWNSGCFNCRSNHITCPEIEKSSEKFVYERFWEPNSSSVKFFAPEPLKSSTT
jgi:hypothetical protein